MKRYVFWVNLALTVIGWWCVYVCFPRLDFPIDWLAAGVFGYSLISLWLYARKVQ